MGNDDQQITSHLNNYVADHNVCYVKETVCFVVGTTVQYATMSSAGDIRQTSLQTIVSTETFMLRWRRCQNGLLSLKRGYDRKNVIVLPGR
jgi:hypothetical protein